MFKPLEEKPKKVRGKKRGEKLFVELLGRAVPAVNTPDGIRAVTCGMPVNPDRMEEYLKG